MWSTSTTDTRHNMFGLLIKNPPLPEGTFELAPYAHDPYVVFKDPSFDITHYTTIDSIKLMEENPLKVERILIDMLGPVKHYDEMLLDLAPKDAERFLSRYFEKKIKLQGIERAYDRFYGVYYHIFYYVELLDLPG